MRATRRPRTKPAPADVAMYAGRRLLGHVRDYPAGVVVFLPDGSRLGSFATRREAADALLRHAAGGAP